MNNADNSGKTTVKTRFERKINLKKLVCITGVLLFGCLFLSAFAGSPMQAQTTMPVAWTEPSLTEKAEIFILKSEKNHLVVYKKGESSPYISTDTLVSALPQSDIMQLEKGIEINGREQLRKAMEDYCS